LLELEKLLKKNSFFLFGPRGTGKTSLIREQLLERAVVIDLLRQSEFSRLSESPGDLEYVIDGKLGSDQEKKWVVIDEVQKIPELLDEVHRLIEERSWHFLLTGSRARKLLLGGRAWIAQLFPFTWKELSSAGAWNMDRALRYGTLPRVYQSEEPLEELDAYLQAYLSLEVQAEGLTRNIAKFQRFLRTAALSCGQLVNFAAVGSDTGIPETTVKEHFEILKDTLIGFTLEPFTLTKKRKAIRTAKFYLFDNGVMNLLLNRLEFDRDSPHYGIVMEQWLINEVIAYNSYFRKKANLSFWQDKNGTYEVDLVVEGKVALEIKSTRKVTANHLKGLIEFRKEMPEARSILVSHDSVLQERDGIEIWPVEHFLEKLWNQELF
jgi:predicted AAA+ superfamily ATPase